jgi:hypothetical protein
LLHLGRLRVSIVPLLHQCGQLTRIENLGILPMMYIPESICCQNQVPIIRSGSPFDDLGHSD